MLDQALFDRHICITEADGLVAVAAELGISRAAAQELHVCYVRQLAHRHGSMSLDGIPHTPEGMPATIEHSSDDPDTEVDDVLLVGASRFQPVPAAVWRYDVGGKPVLRQWFAYRKRGNQVGGSPARSI